MKILIRILLWSAFVWRFAAAAERTFTDSLGTTFTFTGKPKIVASADFALSLIHSGLPKEQIVGTIGSWVTTGSDLDFENLAAGSTLPSDPTPEELEFLSQGTTNLSPTCLHNKRCTEFDLDLFDEVNPDYVFLWGYTQSPFAFKPELIGNLTDAGYETVYIEISQEHVDGDGKSCTGDVNNNCYGLSMIDMIQKNEAIVEALTGSDEMPESLKQDKIDMCEAAESFTKAAEAAHGRGVRIMASYPTEKTFSIANPTADVVLRMFEELGMPLLHPGACPNKTDCSHSYFWEGVPRDYYFPECPNVTAADDLTGQACTATTLYPTDMLLYDDRLTLKLANETYRKTLGDPSLTQGQLEYWPIGGRPYSYRHAAEILNIMTLALDNAKRIHPKTECTPADVTSVSHRMQPLPGGGYACFDTAKQNALYKSVCDGLKLQEGSGSMSALTDVAMLMIGVGSFLALVGESYITDYFPAL